MKQKRKMNRTAWATCIILLSVLWITAAQAQFDNTLIKVDDSCWVKLPRVKETFGRPVDPPRQWQPPVKPYEPAPKNKPVTKVIREVGGNVTIYNTNSGGCDNCCHTYCLERTEYYRERVEQLLQQYKDLPTIRSNDDNWLKWLLLGLLLGGIIVYLIMKHNEPKGGGSGGSTNTNPPQHNTFSPVVDCGTHHHYHGKETMPKKSSVHSSVSGKSSIIESSTDDANTKKTNENQ